MCVRHADELVTCPRLGPSVVAHENQPLLGLGGLEHTSPGWNCIAFFDFFADSLTAGKEDDASEMLRSRFYRKPDSDSSLHIKISIVCECECECECESVCVCV